MSDVREGVEVTFECDHKMVYDKHSDQGEPRIGEQGICRQCSNGTWVPEERMITGLRQCWIETTIRVLFEVPA